jgi:hypothetical protein
MRIDMKAEIKNDNNGNPIYVINYDKRYAGQICYSITDKLKFLVSKCAEILREHRQEPEDYFLIALGDKKYVVTNHVSKLCGGEG